MRRERGRTQIVTVEIEQIERVVDHPFVRLLRQSRLQSLKAARAVGFQHHGLAVEDRTFDGQPRRRLGDRGKAGRPIQLPTREQPCLAICHVAQQPIAVELDLVHPLGAARASATSVASSGSIEAGILRASLREPPQDRALCVATQFASEREKRDCAFFETIFCSAVFFTTAPTLAVGRSHTKRERA